MATVMSRIETLYTEEEQRMLQHYQSAAQELCRIREQDPEEVITMPHPKIASAEAHIPRWHTYINVLRMRDEELAALVNTRADRM